MEKKTRNDGKRRKEIRNFISYRKNKGSGQGKWHINKEPLGGRSELQKP